MVLAVASWPPQEVRPMKAVIVVVVLLGAAFWFWCIVRAGALEDQERIELLRPHL